MCLLRCNITGFIPILKARRDDAATVSKLINILEISAKELDQVVNRINLESQ